MTEYGFGPGHDNGEPLLSIEDLHVQFRGRQNPIRAVNGVSLSIFPGETFGMVGETGAGKSLTAWAAIQLLPPGAKRTKGTVFYGGVDLAKASWSKLASLRGREIGVIVQNAIAALNPTVCVGDQLANAYRAHVTCSRKVAQERAVEGLRQVGIPDPARRARTYPHQFSIGMAQRVLIAMALLHEPKLLIADEPTSGLDVTIQADVLELMMKLVKEKGAALWLITHDLSLVANYCKRAAVMFAGTIIEEGLVSNLFRNPQHPYTIGLLHSRSSKDVSNSRLKISGAPPDLENLPPGCYFAYRCPWVQDRCNGEVPRLLPDGTGTRTRCFVVQQAKDGVGGPRK